MRYGSNEHSLDIGNDDDEVGEDGSSDTSEETLPEQRPLTKRKYLKRKQNLKVTTVQPIVEGDNQYPV
jgi:hypothetical protein